MGLSVPVVRGCVEIEPILMSACNPWTPVLEYQYPQDTHCNSNATWDNGIMGYHHGIAATISLADLAWQYSIGVMCDDDDGRDA